MTDLTNGDQDGDGVLTNEPGTGPAENGDE
jgi:hypothetical protein